VQFKIKKHTPLRKLMQAYCDRQVCYVETSRFSYKSVSQPWHAAPQHPLYGSQQFFSNNSLCNRLRSAIKQNVSINLKC